MLSQNRLTSVSEQTGFGHASKGVRLIGDSDCLAI